MLTRYEWLKQYGICVDCGQADAAKGKTRCLNCLDKAACATMVWRTKNDISEKNKAYCRSRYAASKEAGICVRCHKRPARKGRCDCQICNNKIKSHYILKNGW